MEPDSESLVQPERNHGFMSSLSVPFLYFYEKSIYEK
jgi:hypothetical protein